METILAFVGFAVVAAFCYFKFFKKKNVTVTVDTKPAPKVDNTAPTPAPVVPSSPVPTEEEVAKATAPSPSGPYAGDTIDSLLGKLKAAHDAVVAQGPTPPENAGPWWGNRAVQAGICSAIGSKQAAAGFNRNTAKEMIDAAESGNYSSIHGA